MKVVVTNWFLNFLFFIFLNYMCCNRVDLSAPVWLSLFLGGLLGRSPSSCTEPSQLSPQIYLKKLLYLVVDLWLKAITIHI